jgi:hypothetical protein
MVRTVGAENSNLDQIGAEIIFCCEPVRTILERSKPFSTKISTISVHLGELAYGIKYDIGNGCGSELSVKQGGCGPTRANSFRADSSYSIFVNLCSNTALTTGIFNAAIAC